MKSSRKITDVVIAVIVRNNHVAIVQRAVPEGELIWQFPAGKIEEEESEEVAVEREVKEEIGISCRPLKKLGSRMSLKSPTRLHYWVCEYLSGSLHVSSPIEIAAAQWVSQRRALELITSDIYEPLKQFLSTSSRKKNSNPPTDFKL